MIFVLNVSGDCAFQRKATVPLRRGVKLAYLIMAMCLFPRAIGGYWALVTW